MCPTFTNSMPSGLRQGGGKSGSGDSRHSLIIWSSFPSASSFWRSSDPPIRRSLKKTKGGFVLPGCRCMKEWCNEHREGVDKRVHIEGSDTKLWSAQGFEITWFHFQFLITAANPCKFCQNWFLLWLFWLFQQAIPRDFPCVRPLGVHSSPLSMCTRCLPIYAGNLQKHFSWCDNMQIFLTPFAYQIFDTNFCGIEWSN